jgi:hypothetical protein
MRKIAFLALCVVSALAATRADSLYFTSGSASGSSAIMSVAGPTNQACWLERFNMTNGGWDIVSTYTLSAYGGASLTNSLESGDYGIYRTRTTNSTYKSTNGVGVLLFSLTGLKNLVGNPFDSTTLTNLFPTPTNGMTVYKWDNSLGSYETSGYDSGLWDTNFTIGPAEGFWVYGPSSNSVISCVFAGVFDTNESISLPTGNSLVCSPRFAFWSYPASSPFQVDQLSGTNGYHGGLSGLPAQNSGFNPQSWLSKYNFTTNGYAQYQFETNNTWTTSGILTNIPIDLCEGFFFKLPTNHTWTVTRPIW